MLVETKPMRHLHVQPLKPMYSVFTSDHQGYKANPVNGFKVPSMDLGYCHGPQLETTTAGSEDGELLQLRMILTHSNRLPVWKLLGSESLIEL